MKIEKGFFDETIPYMKIGDMDRLEDGNAVTLFPGSEDLLIGSTRFPRTFGRIYQGLFPKGTPILVLGYDKKIEEPTTPMEVARKRARVIKKEWVKSHVMGISYGGFIAATFAVTRPNLTKSLILGSSAVTMAEEGRSAGIRWMELMAAGKKRELFSEFGGLFKNKVYKWYTTAMAKAGMPLMGKFFNPASNLVNAYQGAFSLEGVALELVEYIDVPVLIIVGSEDTIFSVDACKKTAAGMKNATVEVVEGGTHTLLFESTRKSRKIISSFLEKISQRDGQ